MLEWNIIIIGIWATHVIEIKPILFNPHRFSPNFSPVPSILFLPFRLPTPSTQSHLLPFDCLRRPLNFIHPPPIRVRFLPAYSTASISRVGRLFANLWLFIDPRHWTAVLSDFYSTYLSW
jgi:hypothetical protein